MPDFYIRIENFEFTPEFKNSPYNPYKNEKEFIEGIVGLIRTNMHNLNSNNVVVAEITNKTEYLTFLVKVEEDYRNFYTHQGYSPPTED